MKYIIIILLFCIAVVSCTNSPVWDPEKTNAKANVDQVKSLDSINATLKRIATALENKQPKPMYKAVDTVTIPFRAEGYNLYNGK